MQHEQRDYNHRLAVPCDVTRSPDRLGLGRGSTDLRTRRAHVGASICHRVGEARCTFGRPHTRALPAMAGLGLAGDSVRPNRAGPTGATLFYLCPAADGRGSYRSP
jgi:hypothetical protein